jgi:O-antigen/teichoic acid export membrane protein
MSDEVKFKALKEILYGAGISFILGMIGYVLMFFFKLITARHFGPADFGMYEMVITIISVLIVFSSLGLTDGITRFVPYYNEKKEYSKIKGLLRFTFIIQFISGLIFGGLLYLLSSKITLLFNFSENFTRMLKIISFFIPLFIINTSLINSLKARKKIFESLVPQNVFQKIVLLLGVLIIYLYNLDVFWLVCFLILSYIINFIYLFFKFKKIYSYFKFKTVFKYKEWLFFSIPLLFTGVLVFFMNWTDNFIIGYYLESSDLGIYSIAYSLASYIFFFPSLTSGIFSPVLTELFVKNKTLFQDIFFKVKSWIFIASVFISLPLIIFSKEVLSILFGKEFVIGQNALIVLSICFMISTYFFFNNTIITINKNTKYILYNSLIFLSLNLILNLILIPLLGIFGAAISTGLSMVLLRIGEYFGSRKYLDFKNNKNNSFFKLIFIIIFTSFFLFYLRKFFIFLNMDIFLTIIIILLLYFLIFFMLLFYFKMFDKYDIKLMLLLEKKSGINFGFVKKIIRKFI